MANPLSNMKNSGKVEDDTDHIGGGFQALKSGAYPLTVDKAFFGLSSGGANTVTVWLTGERGAQLRETFYVTSGTKKGCKNTYIKNKGKANESEHYLPGFNAVNSLCLLTVGEELTSEDIEVQKKMINLYSFEESKEVATEVDMIVSICGEKIVAGVFHQIVDKKKLNDDTGDYNPTGETKEVNEINKFFCAKEGYENLTLIEINADKEEPLFYNDWVEKYTDVVMDKTDKTKAKPGAPRQDGKAAPKKAIFGKKKAE